MKVKALGMISGGLDSTLATKIMLDCGVEVEGINFSTGFCVSEHTRNFKEEEKPIRPNEALRLASELKFKMHFIDISKDYLPVVTHPKYGYGANLNPCIDCRIFMLRRIKTMMEQFGAQFVYTGEVLGQRPMSQHRRALKLIETDSEMAGLIVRPLSARLLDPTIPEIKGWIDRNKLLALSGRSRKPQMELAKEVDLENYPQPAGGCCYLTDPQYTKRLKDYFTYNKKESLNQETVLLLKVGRHLRVSDRIKVVVGRNERENNFLKTYEKNRHAFEVLDHPSPVVLAEINNTASQEDLNVVASIAAGYSDGKYEPSLTVEYRHEGNRRSIQVAAALQANIDSWRIE